MPNLPKWLDDAIFYQIYPQSFCDSDGDGIGDINGIISKLDYIEKTGFNALWINPCFDSPFKDAGYDVRDYFKVAPRYGTNEDLVHLFVEAHKRGIRVLLDLVPGHTSDKCRWFKQSAKPERNRYSDRYIWTNSGWSRPEGYNWVTGNADRDGTYMLNFFLAQPALNYGFNVITDADWQISYKDKRVKPTLDAMMKVMRFWLDKGADGFRVDMADSLVKNDPEKTATSSLWRKVRRMLNVHYPEAVIVSEWCNAPVAINKAGFHCDFLLNHGDKLTDYAFYKKDENGNSSAYFCKTSHVSAHKMLLRYVEELRATEGNGYICAVSGNHDVVRLSDYLDVEERKSAFVFLLTLPGAPFVYYGDEIGMRYIPQRSKEGGFHRTGSRTPMQWDACAENLGFSTAPVRKLYLDVDREADAPCVRQQIEKENSLWNTVRALTELRHAHPDLHASASFDVVECTETGVLCYRRGEHTYVLFNPTDAEQISHVGIGKKLFELGCAAETNGVTRLAPQTAVIFEK